MARYHYASMGIDTPKIVEHYEVRNCLRPPVGPIKLDNFRGERHEDGAYNQPLRSCHDVNYESRIDVIGYISQ